MKKKFNLKVLLEPAHAIHGHLEFHVCCSSIVLYRTFRDITLFAKTAKQHKNQNSRFERDNCIAKSEW